MNPNSSQFGTGVGKMATGPLTVPSVKPSKPQESMATGVGKMATGPTSVPSVKPSKEPESMATAVI